MARPLCSRLGSSFALCARLALFTAVPQATAQQATTYAEWAGTVFNPAELAAPEISGAEADPEHCGAPNYLRYALQLPARGPIPASAMPAPDLADGTLSLTFTRRGSGSDLNYVVESSLDLTTWTRDATFVPGTPSSITSSSPDPEHNADRRFLRLRVTDRRQMRVLVPAYFYPTANSPWSRLTAAAAAHPPGVIHAIANINNGPDSGYPADQQSYAAAITAFRAAGGRVLGYVYTGYGSRDAATVMADIDLWYSRFGVDGIFLDEQANTAAALPYYRALRAHIRDQSADALIAGNPGTGTIEDYAAINDVTCVFETDGPSAFPGWAPAGWTATHPSDRFYVLPYNVPATSVAAFVDHAHRSNAGWIYVTDDTLPNPWDTLPSYFEELVTLATDWRESSGVRPRNQ